MLLPWPAKSPSLEYLPSVWIQSRALAVEGDAVRRVEHVVGAHVGRSRARIGVDRRVARDDVEVPGEGGGRVIAAVGAPSERSGRTCSLLFSGWGRPHRRQVAPGVWFDAAVLVVGEAAIGLCLVRVGGHPIRAGPWWWRPPPTPPGGCGWRSRPATPCPSSSRRERDPLACAAVGQTGRRRSVPLSQQVSIAAAFGISAVAHELVEEFARARRRRDRPRPGRRRPASPPRSRA